MAAAVDVNDSLIVAGCDNAVIGVWDAADATEVNFLEGDQVEFNLRIKSLYTFCQTLEYVGKVAILPDPWGHYLLRELPGMMSPLEGGSWKSR